MPLAITLRLDPVANARVEAMVATLTERLPDAYPPHITLAVLSDAVDAMELARVLSAKVVEWPALEVTFAGFGVFPTEPAVLWLAPTPTKLLLELHRLVSALVGVDSVHRHYRLDAWMPHVTLATDLTPHGAADAIRMLSADWSPLSAELVRMDLVRFEPVRVLWHGSMATAVPRQPSSPSTPG